jgi:hypothetical protein
VLISVSQSTPPRGRGTVIPTPPSSKRRPVKVPPVQTIEITDSGESEEEALPATPSPSRAPAQTKPFVLPINLPLLADLVVSEVRHPRQLVLAVHLQQSSWVYLRILSLVYSQLLRSLLVVSSEASPGNM